MSLSSPDAIPVCGIQFFIGSFSIKYMGKLASFQPSNRLKYPAEHEIQVRFQGKNLLNKDIFASENAPSRGRPLQES
jgi:hypothetical protein